MVVLDAEGRVVARERLHQTKWTHIQTVIERLAETYTPNTVALDATRITRSSPTWRTLG